MAESKDASRKVDVYVKLPSGKTVTMDMASGDRVQQIYDRVAREVDMPEDRVLIKYTGKQLNRTHTVGYLGVRAETILKAEIIQIKEYNLYVKLESGRTVSLEVQNLSPIRYIMDLIHTQENIAPDKQILKLGDRILTKRNERVMDAGITNEAILSLSTKATSPPSTKKAKKTSSKKSTRRSSLVSEGSGSESDGGSADERTTNPTEDPNNMPEQDKEAVMSTFDAAGRSVEVVFSFDTTGSMYSCLDKVRSKLKETVERLIQRIPTIRIGIIAHGDFCDYSNYVLKMVDLTSDVTQLVKFVGDVPSTGGGDAPECYEWVLHKAVTMDWSEDSAKALVVIGDCLPHPPSYTDQNINWHDELNLLKGMGVKVYGVKALHQSESLPFYQELSDRTGGAFINFQNFDIISDMFLAVCYREASEAQFDAFQEEIEQGQGQSNETEAEASAKVKDVQAMMNQLKEQTNKTADDETSRYVSAAWWDPQLDHGRPTYSYKADSDTWCPYRSTTQRIGDLLTSSPVASPSSTGVTRSSSLRAHGSSKKSTKTKRSFSFRSRSTRRSGTEESSPEAEVKPMKVVKDKKSCIIM